MLESIKEILVNYPILAPALFIIFRTLPVIIPPIPGLLLDAVGIAVFGWFYGFIYATAAVVTASMISFYIGRTFREPFLGKFISIRKIHEWEDKLSGKQKFWGLIGLRFVSSPFFDIINYVAGLTKIHPLMYFWTSVIVTTPMAFVIYYFGDLVINVPVILVLTLAVVIPLVIFKNKKKGDISMLDAG